MLPKATFSSDSWRWHSSISTALRPGQIEVTSVKEITLKDVTAALARKSGFATRADLLKIAKHGPGDRVFLIDFIYIEQPPI